jgi:putative nucleotidyltransferase with HDIG domain
MKEIEIESLIIGDCLSKDVFNDLGNIILSQGTEITKRHIDYFKKHGISCVYLEDEEPKKHLLEKYENKEFNDQYVEMLNVYKRLYYQIKANQLDFDASELESELKPLIDHVIHDNDVLHFIRNTDEIEEYYIKHAINVALLSGIIAKWLALEDEAIYKVALAGLLHDIGKSQVDQSVLFKVGLLAEFEVDKVKEHAKFGYDIIKENPTIPREVVAAVLFHHERSDGKGYPSGLTQEQTPLFARILAIADVFDAVTSDKVYKKKVSSFKAFSIIKDESFSGLDPKISEVFLKNIANYFVNNKVVLNDGRIGNVVYINKYALNRPLVKIDNEFIDLSMDYSIDIVEVLI